MNSVYQLQIKTKISTMGVGIESVGNIASLMAYLATQINKFLENSQELTSPLFEEFARRDKISKEYPSEQAFKDLMQMHGIIAEASSIYAMKDIVSIEVFPIIKMEDHSEELLKEEYMPLLEELISLLAINSIIPLPSKKALGYWKKNNIELDYKTVFQFGIVRIHSAKRGVKNLI